MEGYVRLAASGVLGASNNRLQRAIDAGTIVLYGMASLAVERPCYPVASSRCGE